MAAKAVSLVLRLPPRIHAAAKRRAKQEARSLNNWIVVALTAYLRETK